VKFWVGRPIRNMNQTLCHWVNNTGRVGLRVGRVGSVWFGSRVNVLVGSCGAWFGSRVNVLVRTGRVGSRALLVGLARVGSRPVTQPDPTRPTHRPVTQGSVSWSGSPQIFVPCLLWPNGWVDQDATLHGGGLGPCDIVLTPTFWLWLGRPSQQQTEILFVYRFLEFLISATNRNIFLYYFKSARRQHPRMYRTMRQYSGVGLT